MADQMDKEKDRTRFMTAARHSGGLFLGYLTAAFLTKQIIDRLAAPKEQAYEKKLQAYVNAKYPVFTPDFNMQDTALEEHFRGLGVDKQAEKDDKRGRGSVLMEKFLNPMPGMKHPVDISGLLSSLTEDKYHPMHPAMALLAMLAGVTTGWGVSSAVSAGHKGRKLDTRIQNARNEMDKLMAEEFVRTRGLDTSAGTEKLAGILEGAWSVTSKTYMLYALLGAAVSLGLAKQWMDERDSSRKRLKAIKEYVNEQAVNKEPPMLLTMPTGFPTDLGKEPKTEDVVLESVKNIGA